MGFSEVSIERRVRNLEARVPLSLRLFSGTKTPEPKQKEILFFVNQANQKAQIRLKIGKTTYIFSAGEQGSDADTLDGLDSTQFLRSDQNDTGTGTYTLSNAVPLALTNANPTIEVGTGAISTCTFEHQATFAATFRFQKSGVSKTFDIKPTGVGTTFVASGTMTWSAAGNVSFITSAGNLAFAATAGDVTLAGNVSGGNIILNPGGGDTDTIIKGDTDAALLHADAGNDRIGIGIAAPLSLLHVDGSITLHYEAFSGADTLDESNYYASCDASGGAFPLTLPSASTAGAGRPYKVKNAVSTANAVTLTADGSDTIDGAATAAISYPVAVVVTSDGVSNWEIS